MLGLLTDCKCSSSLTPSVSHPFSNSPFREMNSHSLSLNWPCLSESPDNCLARDRNIQFPSPRTKSSFLPWYARNVVGSLVVLDFACIVLYLKINTVTANSQKLITSAVWIVWSVSLSFLGIKLEMGAVYRTEEMYDSETYIKVSYCTWSQSNTFSVLATLLFPSTTSKFTHVLTCFTWTTIISCTSRTLIASLSPLHDLHVNITLRSMVIHGGWCM